MKSRIVAVETWVGYFKCLSVIVLLVWASVCVLISLEMRCAVNAPWFVSVRLFSSCSIFRVHFRVWWPSWTSRFQIERRHRGGISCRLLFSTIALYLSCFVCSTCIVLTPCFQWNRPFSHTTFPMNCGHFECHGQIGSRTYVHTLGGHLASGEISL